MVLTKSFFFVQTDKIKHFCLNLSNSDKNVKGQCERDRNTTK